MHLYGHLTHQKHAFCCEDGRDEGGDLRRRDSNTDPRCDRRRLHRRRPNRRLAGEDGLQVLGFGPQLCSWRHPNIQVQSLPQRRGGDQRRLRGLLHGQPRLLRQQRPHHRRAHRAGEALLHLRRAGPLPERDEGGGGRRRPPRAHGTQHPAPAATAPTGTRAIVTGSGTGRGATEACSAQEAQEVAPLPTWACADNASRGAVGGVVSPARGPCANVVDDSASAHVVGRCSRVACQVGGRHAGAGRSLVGGAGSVS